jgi:N,N'-diacetyllegionaminate synthase
LPTFIIAEAGVNHDGNEAKALALVEAAATAGADAVKFQTFSAERLVRRGAAKAVYQERATGSGDQFEMLEALEMSTGTHERLLARCDELGIEFMSTGFDEDALDFLIKLGIRRIKVPSGEITNIPFLRHMAAKDLPIILSTGMASMEEVLTAVQTIRNERQHRGLSRPLAEMVTVLHCTSNYPTAPEDVNLRAMQTIAQQTGLPVGYSDHTLGLEVPLAAVAMGATAIEKHFTLDRTSPGPDHNASLEPDELAEMIRRIRTTETALGSGVKEATASELPIRALVRKSVTAIRPIAQGSAVAPHDVALLRPGDGIPPADLDKVVGAVPNRNIAAGETLHWRDFA